MTPDNQKAPTYTAHRPAAFLDRDGTLIVDPGYTGDPAVVQILPGVPEALKKLEAAGYTLVIVTNQSAIARGYATPAQVEAVNQRLIDLLAMEGLNIAAAYYCPHHPEDNCACRKPKPGLITQAATDLNLDLANSLMFGDKQSDTQAGTAAGCAQSTLLDANNNLLTAVHASTHISKRHP